MQQSPPTAPSPPRPPRQGPVSPPPGLPGALPHFLHSLQAAPGVLGGGGGWGLGMSEQSPAVQNGLPPLNTWRLFLATVIHRPPPPEQLASKPE